MNSSRKTKKSNRFSLFDRFINKFLITGLLTVICLICLKKNVFFNQLFYNHVISDNFDFAYFNSLYGEYFGSSIPFSNFFNESKMVFKQELVYDGFSDYNDGVSLNVGSGYLVPVLDTGLVVFIGEKEGYGNTVIVEQSDGVDVWYSNLSRVNVSLYEYVFNDNCIGECDNNLYVVFKKDGNVLDYREYI